MSSPTDRLRVVVIAPGVPADVGVLDELSEAVDLHLFHAEWPPEQDHTRIPTAAAVTRRYFDPLVRSRRNHLKFVFPGLGRALDEVSPDVVHVLSEPWALFCAQAARWVRRRPDVTFVGHGCDTIWHHGSGPEQVLRRRLVRYTLGAMSAYAGENSDALDLAIRNGLAVGRPTVRLHTNPRSESLWRLPSAREREDARAALGLDPETVGIAVIGRLVPEKGIRVFLDAARLLGSRGFPGRFFIAGSGPLADELADHGAENVRFLGRLDHPGGMVRLMQGIDVLACPSLPTPAWEDQAPRVIIEASMSGCIPVGSPTGGIPEMLEGHGVLAASTEPAAVADAIEEAARIAADPSARADISHWAADSYSDRTVARRLVELWTSLTHADEVMT